MIKYRSNTYYLFDNLPFIIIFCGILSFLTYVFRDNEYFFAGGLIVSLLLFIIIFRQLRKVARVEFNEKSILIKYMLPRLEKRISYSVIKEYQHIHGYKLTSLNIIEYLDSGTSDLMKLKITNVVSNDEFMEFVKWIKDRNNNIEFRFFPTDSKLIGEYEKEFDSLDKDTTTLSSIS